MILNFTQWESLQKNIISTKNWFEKTGLFKGYTKTFDKIAESTLHELSQVRGWDDWDTFLKDIPEDNRLPLKIVVNFANYKTDIDFPDTTEVNFIKDYKEAIKKNEEWSKIWTVHHTLFYDHYQKTFIHYNPKKYGGLLLTSTNMCDSEHNDTSKPTWGLVVEDNKYIKISVGF